MGNFKVFEILPFKIFNRIFLLAQMCPYANLGIFSVDPDGWP